KSNYKDFQLEVPSGGTGNRTLAFKVIRMDNNGSNRNRILMVIDDISEKIRSQELIRKSNEKNLEILNSISDIFVSVNDDWSVSFINKSAEALAGKKAKDVLGKNIWDLFPEYLNSEFYFQLVKAMENKHLIKFEFFDTPKKQWYTYRFYPGKEGPTIYATNITEQKTAIEVSNQS